MKSVTKQDINRCYKKELSKLSNAINEGNHPYHLFALSTINKDISEVRTVVLRDIKLNPLSISFNADVRSPKVKQMLDNSNCTALFYDKEERTQLRFKCTAICNHKNDISKKVWKKTALQSRKCYMGPYAPSTELNKWHPNVPLEFIDKDPEIKASNKGFDNFVFIKLKVIEVDILQLYFNGHIRFKVKDGKKFFLSA